MAARGAAPVLLLLLLFVVAAGLSGFTLLRPASPHDEGLMLQAGSRIAHGQWPYRDFWTNYPPGQALVLAGLDKLFGVSLLSWRIVRVLVDAMSALLAYRLVLLGSGASRPWALAAWLGVAGAMAWPSGPGRTRRRCCWLSPHCRWRPGARRSPERSSAWPCCSGWRLEWRQLWGC